MKRLRSVWANVKTKIRNYLIKKFDLRPQIVYKERDIETIGFSRIVSNRDAQLYPNIVTNYVKDEIEAIIEVDRYSAIKKAIRNSKYNDFILISGRGNRNIYCIGDKMLKFTDLELVQQALKEIGWYYEYK